MSNRLDVRWCPKCKADRVVEVEVLSFMRVETATCQSCGYVMTEEAEGTNVSKREA